MKPRSQLCILFLLSSFPSFAADRETKIREIKESQHKIGFINLQVDNDLFGGTDSNYTNGLRIQFGRQIKNEKYNFTHQPMKKLLDSEWLNVKEREESIYDWSVSFHQYMYTPVNSYALTPPTGERPYSGWLGVEYALNKHDDFSSSGFAVSLGFTGDDSLARSAQNEAHKRLGARIFQGWESQTPTEITFNMHLNHKQRINRLEKLAFRDLRVDGFTEFGGSLGNLRTAAYIGATFRVGFNMPVDYSVPRIQVASSSPSFYTENDASNLSAYVFSSFRASAVAHDISLDGPIFRNHKYTVDSRPLVGEVILGASLRYKLFHITYAKTVRSDEFYGQKSDSHEFGSLQIGLHRHF